MYSYSALIHRLLSGDTHEFAQKHRKKLAWMSRYADWLDEGYASGDILRLMLAYDKAHGTVPSFKAMREYIMLNPGNDQDLIRKTEILYSEVELLESLTKEDTCSTLGMEIDVLLDSSFHDVREKFHTRGADIFTAIACGDMKYPKGTDETGPNAAMTYLRKHWTKDFEGEAPVAAGILHDHTEDVQHSLDAKLVTEDTTGRLRLGFPHLDNCVVVGRKNLRFIGIAGMSGDGKSTLTNTIVYNMLCQGANILYCSLEHDPQEIWESMAFLHGSHEDYNLTLSLHDWEMSKHPDSLIKVDAPHYITMQRILRDIRSRRNLPGLLDVQAFSDWDSITDHLATNYKRNQYAVLVIDYIARLDTPGADARFRDKAIENIIHAAQRLSRSFDEGRGLVIISPMQVNREGNKKARTAEEGVARYDLNAISSFSAYQHDMDLILSVWSDEAMKLENTMEVQCLKKRKGKQPLTERLVIDRSSGFVTYKVSPGLGYNLGRKVANVDYVDGVWEDLE